MKIYFSTSGGLMGILNNNVMIDSDTFPEKEKYQFENLIRHSDFFNLQSDRPPRHGAADYINYSISIEDGKQKHTVKTNDVTMSSQLEPVIRFLQNKIRK